MAEDTSDAIDMPGKEEEEPGKNGLLDLIDEAMKAVNDDDNDLAISKCHEAIKIDPEAAEPFFLLGLIAKNLGETGRAISLLETAHQMDPNTRDYADTLGVMYTKTGQLTDGLYFAKLATALEPHPLFSVRLPPSLKDIPGAIATATPSTHRVEAMRLFNVADYRRSLKECELEIRLNNARQDVYVLLARNAIHLRKYNQAVGALQAAVQLDEDDAMALALLANALLHLGRYAESEAATKRAMRMAPTDAEIYGTAMNALLRGPSVDHDAMKSLAIEFSKRFRESIDDEFMEPVAKEENEPISVGFLSNAFYRATDHDLYQGWFAKSDEKRVGYRGYQQSVPVDSVTTTFQAGCEDWRAIYKVDPFTLSLTLQTEGLDALVDISGFDGPTRMSLPAMVNCPVRVGVAALPEPGLAPGITHILSDEVLEEGDRLSLLPGQKCVTVEGSLLAREPFEGLTRAETCPVHEKGFLTFGGVLSLDRLTPDCAILWGEVLRNHAGSKLLLLDAEKASDDTRAKVREYFALAGVADRILLPLDEVPAAPETLEEITAALSPVQPAQIQEIDVLLDTCPINGRAEICQSLWMGVPVVTLRSARRFGLLGASILTAAGRVNWIADDRQSFHSIVDSLVKDIGVLVSERERLRTAITESVLFDVAGARRSVREALSRTCREAREKGSPGEPEPQPSDRTE